MGLVVAWAKWWIVSNMTTGVSFLGKEGNYHLHMTCLVAAEPTFKTGDLVIPDNVKVQLNPLQNMYLIPFVFM